MDVLQSFLLGIIQGLTEFLPISSSGHLVLGKQILGVEVETGITFEVVVHFGTLCSILIYYRKIIWDLIVSGLNFLKSPSAGKEDPNVKTIGFILVSMIPAMLVGFTLEEQVESIFGDPMLVCVMLLVTGLLLFSTRFVGDTFKDVNLPKSFLIGIAQSFAMIPGISRSGSTISAALWLNVKREEAANFSFLMLIPVIAGAMLLEVKDLIELGVSDAELINLVVGFLAAFISGYYALKYLIIILKKKGFHYFAYYCWIVGGAGLVYFLV
ncbi:undecaprenyl-diphosphate phosphatase [Gracilimonas mengyeensis]|uniref:Undecaprenyl-diphosphatase n=1 Tax=Gracilimonas mengyeensis TaxID=1302730 RepID=A0A521EEA1_9BACT|nr:undecaprenyl-diphosphate phosphatase [Gracilimonas mengyeensis]SMO82253.1 undecaprenyl-diphosphatase [Gracilimonas mengyeensis]